MLGLPRIRARRTLLSLLRGELSPASLPAAGRAALLAAAVQEGVGAVIAPLHPSFAAGAGAARFSSILHGAATRRAVDALEAAGLPCAVLKGAAAAALAWDEPSQRPQVDVDLLLRPADLVRGAGILREAGLAGATSIPGVHHHHATLDPRAPGGTMFELHRVLSSDLPLAVETEALLERRIRIAAPDGLLPTLSLEDTAAFLAVHAAVHALERLSWVADLAGLSRKQPVDWSEAVRRAKDWGAALPVFLTWNAAASWLRAPIPAAALAALGVRRRRRLPTEALLRASRLAGESTTGPLSIAYRLSLLPGLSELPAHLAHKLADRRETAESRSG